MSGQFCTIAMFCCTFNLPSPKILVLPEEPGRLPARLHEVHRLPPPPPLPLHPHLRPARDAVVRGHLQLRLRHPSFQLRLLFCRHAHCLSGGEQTLLRKIQKQKRFHFPDSICLLPLLRTHCHCFKKRLMATALKEVDCNSSERMVVPHCRWLDSERVGVIEKQ